MNFGGGKVGQDLRPKNAGLDAWDLTKVVKKTPKTQQQHITPFFCVCIAGFGCLLILLFVMCFNIVMISHFFQAACEKEGAIMAEPTFFSEMKKGEVNELRIQLRSATTEKDPMKLRSAVQKVISYMTLGIDMSQLFTEMVMVCLLPNKLNKIISNCRYR